MLSVLFFIQMSVSWYKADSGRSVWGHHCLEDRLQVLVVVLQLEVLYNLKTTMRAISSWLGVNISQCGFFKFKTI